jgi:hypothetical protein
MPVDANDLNNGLEDMLFWVDDDCVDPDSAGCLSGLSDGCAFDYSGGNNYVAKGIFYVPGATLGMAGGGSADSAVQIIVNKFRPRGSANITINYTGFVPTELPWMRLVE